MKENKCEDERSSLKFLEVFLRKFNHDDPYEFAGVSVQKTPEKIYIHRLEIASIMVMIFDLYMKKVPDVEQIEEEKRLLSDFMNLMKERYNLEWLHPKE